MYADDTTANDTTDIHSWYIKYELIVHTKKSNLMILQQRRLIGPLSPVAMGHKCLEYVNSEKLLGIEN